MTDVPERTVLVGCSFAGLEFLYRYVRRAGRPAPGALTVVDPRALHPYIPLAHEAISRARADAALYFDARAFCERVGARFVAERVTGVELAARTLALADGARIAYDRLVLAVGSVPAVPGAFAGAPSLVPAKFVADAAALRERIRACTRPNGPPPHVVVAGGGITGSEWGAELAGAGVDGRPVRVTIVEREPTLLAAFKAPVRRRAARVLGELGAELRLGRAIASVSEGGVTLDDGTAIEADAVLWAGGVRPAPLVATLAAQGVELTAGGHIAVTPRLAVRGAGHVRGVYAIGDAVRVVDGGAPWPTMERAIEAIWQGALLGRRLASGHGPTGGPRHRLRRDFFYGLSLGPRHSLFVYKRLALDSRLFVWFRRWLQWAYYQRFRVLAGLKRQRVMSTE